MEKVEKLENEEIIGKMKTGGYRGTNLNVHVDYFFFKKYNNKTKEFTHYEKYIGSGTLINPRVKVMMPSFVLVYESEKIGSNYHSFINCLEALDKLHSVHPEFRP